MSITIPFKLNKPASQFQAGEYTGFGIRTGIKYRDPKTQQDSWTNYQAVIFAKSPAQIDFYARTLVEGAMAVVSAEKQAIESFDGNNGTVHTINLINARLDAVQGPGTQQAAQGQARQQPAQSQAPRTQPQQPENQKLLPDDYFKDDIPW